MSPKAILSFACLSLLFSIASKGQQFASHSSHSQVTDTWNFGISSGASFGVNSNENTLFSGNGLATRLFGRYYFGNVGLGLSSGFIPGSINDNSLNNFLAERKLVRDQLQIQTGKPFNGYLAFGPSFRFGNRVQLAADLQGGMFLNNPGNISITQQGAQRATYRFTEGAKNFYPGLSGNINIIYPLSASTHFFLATGYLQSKSSIRLLDLARGVDVPAEQTRNVKLFTVGLGITKSFGTAREAASGLATGRKHIAGVKYEDIVTTRETGSGQASGKRVLPTVNKISIDEPGIHRKVSPRDIATGQASGKRINESCGPITVKKTYHDGTMEEKTFACPDDMVLYEEITNAGSSSDKSYTVPHVLEKGGIIHRDIAARNILLGRVRWINNSSVGIITNKTVAAGSDAAALKKGMIANIYTREAGSGLATGKRSREAGSGIATGRRQYQPLYDENNETNFDSKMGNVKSNPLYKGTSGSNPLYEDKGSNGTNPLYQGKANQAIGGDDDCDGVSGLTVYLIDAGNGSTVATTQTEACGNFWFANVPSGNYIVKVAGGFPAKKEYGITVSNRMDLAGELLAANDCWSIDLTTDTGSVEQAIIKTKTKSNQSNDRTSSSLVWSPRSNKIMNASVGDLDGDGVADLLISGSLPGAGIVSAAISSVALRPGDPIGGISIKCGKNPGGNLRTTQTNSFGEFEFTDLDEGTYYFNAEMNYYINDETFISLGDEFPARISRDVDMAAIQSSKSLKTGSNNNNGMPNRISMNVTVPKQTQGSSFGEKVNAGITGNDPKNQLKAQNNNTVRSNRIDNAIIMADLDGDGTMESSYLNINGEIATISIGEARVQTVAGNNAAGGINITEPGTFKVVEKATSGLKDVVKTQVRLASPNPDPVKWMAPETMTKRVWGDPHVDEKDGTLYTGNENTSVAKGKWSAADVAIKAIRCADGVCIAISASGNDYPATSQISLHELPAEPVAKASIYIAGTNGKIYKKETDASGGLSLNGLPSGVPLEMMVNMGADGSDDMLITFTTDAHGNIISNVLKTKHDTAKNAINNIR